MRKFLLLLFAFLAPLAVRAADDRMLYVEYRLTGKHIAADSFDAQVKKVWRIGNKFLRFEDAPNPATKVHGLIIVAEPDIWIADLNINKAQHTVDPGPTFKVHFPLLASEPSEKLREIEFGHELEFFVNNGAVDMPPQDIDGARCKPRKLQVEDREVTLCTKSDDTPVQIAVRAPDYEYTVKFVRYERDRPPNKALFQLPADVQVQQ